VPEEGPLVEIRDLHVDIPFRGSTLRVLRGVDLQIGYGESVGLVGESGSGKTLTCMSIVGMLPRTAKATSGTVSFRGRNVLTSSERELRRIRGREIGTILQDPMSCLNPSMTVGRQIAEPMRHHLGVSRREGSTRAVGLLEEVQIPDAPRRVRDYPHAMSGGMKQRVGSAIAIACKPQLIIADEPTTALDVTIQGQYLELLRRLKRDTNCALIVVAHDLSVVSAVCDWIFVMYAGRIVESGPTEIVLTTPRHPYTAGLLKSLPRLDGAPVDRLPSIPGQPPDPAHVRAGCSFAPRCYLHTSECDESIPPLTSLTPRHASACFHNAEVD
jgi:oligopeptide/dipeptide ABC transporter ATP-binding protein